jgi:DNA-binding protein Fis
LESAVANVKTEIKADLVRLVSAFPNVNTDIGRLERTITERFETLIRSVNEYLENYDGQIENAVKELVLQKRENEITKKE